MCVYVPSSTLSPGVAVLRDSGPWREMSSHVHTGTLRYLHTATAVQNLTHCEEKNDVITTTTRVTGGEKGRCREWAPTRACAAIHTLFLTDLLDVETMAGCRAGLGAFTVLHPNWTLGD